MSSTKRSAVQEPNPFSKYMERGSSGKLRISEEGWRRLVELKRKRKLAQYEREKRARVHTFFTLSKPLRIKTSNGFSIVILRDGFSNVYKGVKTKKRSLILTLVNGKKLFFYKSSGEASKARGTWYPTHGPEVEHELADLSWMTKSVHHPNPTINKPESFPDWVNEIRQYIKKHERQLRLHRDWGKNEYLQLTYDLNRIPFTKSLRMKYQDF